MRVANALGRTRLVKRKIDTEDADPVDLQAGRIPISCQENSLEITNKIFINNAIK